MGEDGKEGVMSIYEGVNKASQDQVFHEMRMELEREREDFIKEAFEEREKERLDWITVRCEGPDDFDYACKLFGVDPRLDVDPEDKPLPEFHGDAPNAKLNNERGEERTQ